MRISLIFSLLFYANVVWGTVTASAVFEINAAGSSTGACIFDAGVASPGTDRSQGTSAFKSGTDLATSNGTTNPCIVSSASAPFTTADAGNSIIHTAGTNWTVQRSIIASVDGSGNATLDRACGSAASLSGGTWKMGQACALGNATAGISDDDLLEMARAGNTIYAKSGTYNTTAISISGTAAGTATSKIKFIGYNATRGDNPLPNSGNQPIFNNAANTLVFGSHWNTSYIETNSTISGGWGQGTVFQVYKCKSTNSSGSAARVAISLGNGTGSLIGSDISSTNGVAVQFVNANGVNVLDNVIHDSVDGIRANATVAGNYTIIGNIIRNITGDAIDFTAGALTGGVLIRNNTIYCASSPSGSSTAFNWASGSTNLLLFNNILYGCITGAKGAAASEGQLSLNNNFFNNTTNRSNWTTGSGDIALDPQFVAAGSNNFAVGANMKAGGFPSLYPQGSTTSYIDIGAIQRLEDYPGVTLVSNGTAYGNNSLTGTYVTVGASSVAIGAPFGPSSSLTGTYAATERYTDVTASSVLTSFGVYRYNSLSQNRTPTYVHVGADTNVKHDVSYGVGLTGTYRGLDLFDILATSRVQNGFSYLSNGNTLTGTLDAVTINNLMCSSSGTSRNTRATGIVR